MTIERGIAKRVSKSPQFTWAHGTWPSQIHAHRRLHISELAGSVDYYGSQMPLNQIAQIHAPEPQMITVNLL